MTRGTVTRVGYNCIVSATVPDPVGLPVRVLVADDSDGVRELVILLLDMESDFVVVGQARDGLEAVERARKSPAVELVKRFHWTNEDQNAVARMIAVDKMTPDAAAEKWVTANRAKVDAWLGK